mgnify:CR=1 FL=1
MLSTTLSNAQIDQYLSDYKVSEEQGAILISWTTSAGFTCEDIKITFGIDSTAQTVIYTYPGICGAESTEEQYTYLFKNVIYNQPNYFQIDLGSFGISPILSITVISVDGQNPKVYPNPANNDATLIFANPNQELVTISIYSPDSKMAITRFYTRDKQVSISEFNLNTKGIYFFTINIKGIRSRGKFLFL